MPSRSFTLPDLAARLWELLDQVPAGRVTTYGDLAEALGDRVAARWVGQVLLDHDHGLVRGEDCPCHRVVRHDGAPGLYAVGGTDAKRRRLAGDGIPLRQGRVDLAEFGFAAFSGPRPLEALRRRQEALIDRVELRPDFDEPDTVGGVDVSYVTPDHGIAAYALVDAESGELLWSTTHSAAIRFPYVSSYLAYRELPILMELIARVRDAGRLAPVVLVDGSGILHPRRAGIATQLGVESGLPTIGVTKKLLCGTPARRELAPGESTPVLVDDQILGTAMRLDRRSGRPLYVSPGHRVDVETAARVVAQTCHDRRLPEPIYWADRLSRAEARATDSDGSVDSPLPCGGEG